MDAFEENIQTFNNTIYGSEMKDAMFRCVSLLYATINYYALKLGDIKIKIENAEKGV